MAADRLKSEADPMDVRARAELREAYERGRKDERASRRRHPVLMTLTVLAAVVGVALLGLAAVNGSFSRAGGVVDRSLSVAASEAQPQVEGAAREAGAQLKDAGRSVGAGSADMTGREPPAG